MNAQTNLKVKSMNLDLSGIMLPVLTHDGSVGQAVEDILENMGFKINRGQGVDLQDYKVEIKTRKLFTNSPHTICWMRTQDIWEKPYAQSAVCEKLQQQLRIYWNPQLQEIARGQVYDFSAPEVQQVLELDYQMIAQQLKENPQQSSSGTQWLYAELADKNRHKMRVSHASMKKMEAIALGYRNYHALFE